MKLFTDQGNSQALKILISAEVSGAALVVQISKNDEKVVPFLSQGRLPVLEINDDQQLFSTNAACRYLLTDQDQTQEDSSIEQWLEWESSLLRPVIQHVLVQSGNKQTDSPLVAKLKALLHTLEAAIQNNEQYLAGEVLSAADVVIWSTLFPTLAEGCVWTAVKDIVCSYPSTVRWFGRLALEKEFVAAQKKMPGIDNWDLIKGSLLGQPLPLLPTADSTSSKASTAESEVAVSPEELEAAEKAWNHGRDTVAAPRELPNPILPQEGEKNILITSALPYVNNVPHLGNIIGCVLSADVFARFCRLRNLNVLYVCGTDEYGTATENKALEEGLTCQQICEKYYHLHVEVYRWFQCSFDYFGRTTTQQQTDIAQAIFWGLNRNGYILKDSVDQLKCEKCNRFLADRFVEGTCPFCKYEDARGDQCDACGKLINAVELKQPRCHVCRSTPVIKTSQHLFMDLPKLQPLLEKHLNRAFNEGLWSSNSKNIARTWIRDGLKPRCISRDLKWGTPVPLEGYTDKVFYVWYDAPIGYISITANYTDQWEKWWKNPSQVELYNFMAKDNVPFHSVIFPSTLLGSGENWTVVNHMSATEYLNYEDGKFSKSRGVGVFGTDAKDTGIPADVWRFYLLYIRPETQDSAFSWDDFVLKNNSELLNNLGNFINRALMFVSNNFGGVIPRLTLTEEDKELLVLITRELKAYVQHLHNIKIRDGIRNILNISRLGNQYVQSNKPWVLLKGSEEEKSRAGTVVGLATNIACLLSTMVQPYMPSVSETIRGQLNAPASCQVLVDTFICYLPEGHKIGQPKPLFSKIEACQIERLKKRFAGAGVPAKAATVRQKPTVEHAGQPDSATAEVTAEATAEATAQLSARVTAQGELVRKLKMEKAEKAKIDEEVATLLALKHELAIAQGQNPNEKAAGSKSKKGKGKKK